MQPLAGHALLVDSETVHIPDVVQQQFDGEQRRLIVSVRVEAERMTWHAAARSPLAE